MGEENLKLVTLGSVPYKPIVPVASKQKRMKKKIKLYSSTLCSMTDLYAH